MDHLSECQTHEDEALIRYNKRCRWQWNEWRVSSRKLKGAINCDKMTFLSTLWLTTWATHQLCELIVCGVAHVECPLFRMAHILWQIPAIDTAGPLIRTINRDKMCGASRTFSLWRNATFFNSLLLLYFVFIFISHFKPTRAHPCLIYFVFIIYLFNTVYLYPMPVE